MEYKEIVDFYNSPEIEQEKSSIMDALILPYLTSIGYVPALGNKSTDIGKLSFSKDRQSILAIPDSSSKIVFTTDHDYPYEDDVTLVIVNEGFKVYQPRFGEYFLENAIVFDGSQNDKRYFDYDSNSIFDFNKRKDLSSKYREPINLFSIQVDLGAFKKDESERLKSLTDVLNHLINNPKEDFIDVISKEYNDLFGFSIGNVDGFKELLNEDFTRRQQAHVVYSINTGDSKVPDGVESILEAQHKTIDSLNSEITELKSKLNEVPYEQDSVDEKSEIEKIFSGDFESIKENHEKGQEGDEGIDVSNII